MPNLPISARLKRQSQRGFSLIEILVSTTLLVFLLMTATTMFMTFLVSNAKTNVRHVIKGEGTAALSRMEFLIRNAETLTVTLCDSNFVPTTIQLKNFNDPSTYTLERDGSQIKYSSDTIEEFLTSSTTSVSDLQFKCYGTVGGNRRIEISFTLSSTADALQSTTTTISESFRSTVQVRN